MKLLGDFLWRGSKARNRGLELMNVDMKSNSLGLDRNAREWNQCVVDYNRPIQVTSS
jgi:hypothetical protein